MIKARRFFYLLTIYILIFFISAMLFSYLPEAIRTTGFFGDTLRTTPCQNCMSDDNYDWGVRHYWYSIGSIIILMIAILRIGYWCVWYWTERSHRSNFGNPKSIKDYEVAHVAKLELKRKERLKILSYKQEDSINYAD